MISISFLSCLLYFLACLVLAVNANAAKSLTSKGNKPSAAIDETAEMLCNVLVQASKELIHDGSVKVNLLKEYLRQDCSKLPKALNLVQKVNLREIIFFFHSNNDAFFYFSVKPLLIPTWLTSSIIFKWER